MSLKQIVTIQIQVEMPTVLRESGESYSRYMQRLDNIARQFVADAVANDGRVTVSDLQVVVR